MKTIRLKTRISGHKNMGIGVFSFILAGDILKEAVGDLDKMYLRKNLCLKVFKDDIAPIEEFVWGYKTKDHRISEDKSGSNHLLWECTAIQNLFAIEGLAPRVYDIVLLKGETRDYYAQVTDYLQGKETKENHSKIAEIREKYGLYRFADPNKHNYINGKIVDFQGFKFSNKKIYKERLIRLANTHTDWGSKSGISYESVNELGIVGQRNTNRRVDVLGIDKYDFKGKTVLDIGCSTGSFCRLAARKGAARVVGIDTSREALAALEISNFLKDWNIDFYGYNFSRNDSKDYKAIKSLTGLESFDIVFFLSVHAQIGYPSSYMARLCKEVCFLEGHSGHHEETFRPLMEKDFKKVIFKGKMKNNARPALVGIK